MAESKPTNAIWCPSCGGDKGHSVPDRLASIGSVDGYAESWEECQHCEAIGWIVPECCYCGQKHDEAHQLRALPRDPRPWVMPEFICAEDYSGGDEGPCFDDLEAAA